MEDNKTFWPRRFATMTATINGVAIIMVTQLYAGKDEALKHLDEAKLVFLSFIIGLLLSGLQGFFVWISESDAGLLQKKFTVLQIKLPSCRRLVQAAWLLVALSSTLAFVNGIMTTARIADEGDLATLNSNPPIQTPVQIVPGH